DLHDGESPWMVVATGRLSGPRSHHPVGPDVGSETGPHAIDFHVLPPDATVMAREVTGGDVERLFPFVHPYTASGYPDCRVFELSSVVEDPDPSGLVCDSSSSHRLVLSVGAITWPSPPLPHRQRHDPFPNEQHPRNCGG